MTAEQKARDMLERMSVEGAQTFSAGDIVELANLIATRDGVAAIVAKMRADLTAIGGFDNCFVGQPAVNVRDYIVDLERELKA